MVVSSSIQVTEKESNMAKIIREANAQEKEELAQLLSNLGPSIEETRGRSHTHGD